jgi:cbb3-type cytochrome oxidase maturation protein
VLVIVFLIAAGGTVAAGFLVAFAWAVRSGQYDDTATPPIRILFEDPVPPARHASEGPAS